MGLLRRRTKKDPKRKHDFTFIGDSCRIEGSLNVKGELVINGKVEGTIRCDTVSAGRGSRIKGKIKARNATFSGAVECQVDVTEHLAIMKTGKVTGGISYGTLSIEKGGILRGKSLKLDSKGSKVVSLDEIDILSHATKATKE